MPEDMRFDGRVAIVTGAGGGLGRAYAMDLAKRGAKVVVNDLGGSTTGEGSDSSAADKVVAEIKAAGGEAIPNYDSVVDGAKIVKTAVDAWGKVDIVINNAGILRDVSFHKMSDKDWNLLNQVHLKGSYAVTRAAWPYMRDNKYGRIIMVTSSAGLYGNFGQAHYSTVKMGLLGLSNTLAQEGAKRNIHCNTIAPIAGSRMTATIMPPDLLKALKPEFVSPLVTFLVHESTEENGSVFEVGAGWVSKLRWERTKGHGFPLSEKFTPDLVQKHWSTVTDFNDPDHPSNAQDAFGPIMENIDSASDGGDSSEPAPAPKKGNSGGVDLSTALGYEMPPVSFAYTEKDAILYALGIGVAQDNQVDPKELQYTYENHEDFAVFPTYGVVIPTAVLAGVLDVPGLEFNPMLMLHGEQYMEVRKQIPTSGNITSFAKVSQIYDKGKAALLLLDVESKDENGDVILFNRFTLFIRGIGGFGGKKSPPSVKVPYPDRAPDAVGKQVIPVNQALVYRLAGDSNPLHADPDMATMGGFDRPILHGLCSFGYGAHAVLQHFADNDPARFKSIKVRFAKHVFPGETIITEMWKLSETQIAFRCKVAERDTVVLDQCILTLHPKGADAGAAQGEAAADTEFAAATTLAALSQAVNEDIVQKVKATFRFVISKGGVTRSWFLDLKNGPGSVSEDADPKMGPKAGCTITISDGDFVQLMSGKLNPQNAFMTGKIKVAGNIMLAQKLSVLTDQVKKGALAANKTSAGGDAFIAEQVFAEMKKLFSPELVKKVNTVYKFTLSKGKTKRSWVVDLKSGEGSIKEGDGKADCTIIMTDANFLKLMTGKLNPQSAFMTGKLKVKGNMMAAQKLSLLKAPKAKL